MVKPVEVSYSIDAGDPLEFIVTTKGGLTGSIVRATIKRYAKQADADAIAQLDSTPGGGIVVQNDKQCRVRFESAHTRPCGDGLFYYDVIACPNGREAYQIQEGTVRTSQRITRATSRIIGVHGASIGRSSSRAEFEIFDPLAIFGASRLAFWLRVEDWTAASWQDVTGNITITQVIVSKQATAANGINGLPTVLFDGIDDFMQGVLSAPILAGTRPHLVSIRKLANLSTAGAPESVCLRSAAGGASYTSVGEFYRNNISGMAEGWQGALDGGHVASFGAPDAQPHIDESSWGPDPTRRFFRDGGAVPFINTPLSIATPNVAETLTIGAQLGGLTPANVHFRDVFCVRDQPSAQELALMRAWCQQRIVP